ncbi:hypothetical protein MKX34_11700 [Paenibacillus sp. FSL R5-0636]|uniref:hypothetical protein n=1 Tax=Paenibacillus TaxID=44249 RepID=UPI00096F2B31|nr:hypothetical protein [Paenibacillus odorifer]OMD04723.1 hypothetical protein BJP49_22910 [Paenibacillus odorifer]
MDYVKIETATSYDIQKYLDEGWIIIDTSKEFNGRDDTSIKYHVGYPTQKRIQDLMRIISMYEEHGFKNLLFSEIAKKNGVDLDDYKLGEWSLDETSQILSLYESVVQNKKVTFSKALKPITPEKRSELLEKIYGDEPF